MANILWANSFALFSSNIAYLYRLESKPIARSLFKEDCVCDLSS